MSLTNTIFELIDMRSFSNLWFWIALAVMWSTASHWVLGVPFDMIQRAQRQDGQAAQDLHDIVRVNVNRVLYIGRVSGLWILGFGCFFLTILVMLGFGYGVEFAQALFLLGFPMALLGLMSFKTAELIEFHDPQNGDLFRVLKRHRFWTQALGMVSIFVTALWGMYQNITVGILGG